MKIFNIDCHTITTTASGDGCDLWLTFKDGNEACYKLLNVGIEIGKILQKYSID